ncbi:50S ribosomal protein L7/L12-serine acetyltransferase, partial [Cronobacter turicensis]|nr:50S ribosomal protein L7/L12-serine acetyltransferase [Cronobacter turicensis]
MQNATSATFQDERLIVNDNLELHSVHERFTGPLFSLVQRNKDWLQKSMNWPQYVNKIEDT